MPTLTLKPVAGGSDKRFDAISSATNSVCDKGGSSSDVKSKATVISGAGAKDGASDRDDDADDVFSTLTSHSVKGKRRAKKKKRRKMKINFCLEHSKAATRNKQPDKNERNLTISSPKLALDVDTVGSSWESDDDWGDTYQYEEHDPLDFYAETHEEQDPAFAVFTRAKQRQRREAELSFLEKTQQEVRSGLEDLLKAKWSEQDRAFRRQVSKLRSDMAAKQEMQREQLLLRYKEQTKSDSVKISEGSKWLQKKHQEEIDRAMVLHQQQAAQLGQDRAAQSWSQMSRQLQAKHQKEQRQFQAKEAELKKKSDDDYRVQVENLTQHHLKRRREMDQVVQKLEARFRQQQQQQRQHHLRRHEERMKKKREGIARKYDDVLEKDGTDPTSNYKLSLKNEEDRDKGTLKADGKQEEADGTFADGRVSLSLPFSKAKSTTGSSDSRLMSVVEGRETSDAVLRQKRRKNAMSGTPIQLVVEIHNEGIFVLARGHVFSDADKHSSSSSGIPSGADASKHKTDQSSSGSSGRATDFIPWGHRARHILHSIVCGEIPEGWCDRIDPGSGGSSKQSSSAGGHGGSSGGSGSALQGGQVKCMVSDMRVSEATASTQRATAMTEVKELRAKAGTAELERKAEHASALLKKAEGLSEKAAADEKECETAMKKAASDAEKAKQILHAFRVKAAQYFNADGTPSQATSEDNQRKLVKALMTYKSNCQMTEQRENMIRETLAAAKAKASKTSEIAKQAAKASQNANAALNNATKKFGGATKKSSSRVKGSVLDPVDEEAKHRVEDVLAAFRLVADRRRKHMNTKKSGDNNTNPAWENSLSGLPEALRKSLWQKMQRRRLTIVLRPTRTSVLAEARSVIKDAAVRAAGPTPSEVPSVESSKEKVDKEIQAALRSEQLLLLALHPEAPSPPPPSVPPTSPSDPWAEPGWLVVLDSLQNEPPSCSDTQFLPSTSIGSMFQQFLSGCASAPGRQAAALLKPRHLSMLTAPLSAISEASAPAETVPLSSANVSQDDPFFTSNEAMEAGYKFDAKAKPQRRESVKAVQDTRATSPPPKRRKSGKGAGEGKSLTVGGISISETDRAQNRKSHNKKTMTGQSSPPNSSPPPRAYMTDSQALAAQKAKDASVSQKRTGYQTQGMAAIPVPAVAGGYGQPGMAEQQAQYHRLMKQREAMQMQQQQQHQQQHQAQPPQKDLSSQQRHLQQLQQYHTQQQQHQQQQMAQMQMLRQQQFQAPPHMQNQPPPMQMQFPMQQQTQMQQQPPQPQAPPGVPAFPGPPTMAMRGVSGGSVGQQVPGGAAMSNATGGQPGHRPGQQPGARRGRGKDDDMNDPLLMLFNN